MFCALQSGEITAETPDGELQNSTLVANHHILDSIVALYASGKDFLY